MRALGTNLIGHCQDRSDWGAWNAAFQKQVDIACNMRPGRRGALTDLAGLARELVAKMDGYPWKKSEPMPAPVADAIKRFENRLQDLDEE